MRTPIEHKTCHVFGLGLASILSIGFALAILANSAFAQISDTNSSPSALKKLSLEELMDIEVTSVSRSPEKLFDAASAVQVITGDDVRRSGATSLAEAL